MSSRAAPTEISRSAHHGITASCHGIAERHGLAGAVDRWVIHAAVELAATEKDSLTPLELNLSAASLADPDLPALRSTTLAQALAPSVT